MGWGLPCSAARGGSARVAAVTLNGTAAGGVHLLSPSAAGDGQMRSGPCRSPRRSVTTVDLFKEKTIYKNLFNKKVENALYTCALLQKLASDLHRQHFKAKSKKVDEVREKCYYHISFNIADIKCVITKKDALHIFVYYNIMLLALQHTNVKLHRKQLCKSACPLFSGTDLKKLFIKEL